MSKENPEKVDAYLVAGGRFHDIDYARLELLKLLSEHPYIRVKVGSD
ncbi:MAG: ThuA domain-containing protein, partial [Acidimicrobiales bacterium]|nr:ThuA domain-containing protein [Acidimicrobiales bacterium]